MIGAGMTRNKLRLHVEVTLWRHGWLGSLLTFLTIALLTLQLWWIPQQTARVQSMAKEIDTERATQVFREAHSRAPKSPSAEGQTLLELQRVCYTPLQLSGLLRQINQLAISQGLVLAQSDFQTSSDSNNFLRQVQINLPLRTTYPQLHHFVEAMLRQFPGVSLDQLLLKRDAVGANQADVRLKISIWLAPAATTDSADGKP